MPVNTEVKLTEERQSLVKRIEAIDQERQYLKRKAWRAERERDGKRKAAPLKRQRETLFAERNRCRQRLVEVNHAVKELRRAGMGTGLDDSLASSFMVVAKANLDEAVYEEILGEAALRTGSSNQNPRKGEWQ